MTKQGGAPATQGPRWQFMLLLGLLTVFGPLSIDMYLPSLPAIGLELTANATQTQATMASFLAGMAIGQFLFGAASDRFGRRPAILFGLGIYVLASLVCALTDSIEVLIGARFAQALGACAGTVVARAIVRDKFDHIDTARILSQLLLITMIAPIVGPLIGGGLFSLAGWRSNFWALTAFSLLITLSSLFWLKESRSAQTARQARAENPFQAYFALLRQWRLVGYVLAGGMNGATLFAYISASPELLIQVYGIPAAHFGWVFSANAVGIIIAGQVNRVLLRRRTPDQLLRYSSIASVVVGALLVWAAGSSLAGPWTVLPLLFVVMASYGFVQGNTMAGGLNVDPRRSGSISALMGGVSFAMGALASSVVGSFQDGTARPMALTMLTALVGSALALQCIALPRNSEGK